MKNIRKYGNAPYSIAVVHGGPGAPGEMAPVAKELSSSYGILEPLQTASSVTGQVQELKTILEENATLPVVLVGYSWGAMLSLIVAAQYPSLVKKLILVGSAPLETHYAKNIMQTRLTRLNDEEKRQINKLFDVVNNPLASDINKNIALKKIGILSHKAESYAPIAQETEEINFEHEKHIYESVWGEAAKMRQSGDFLKLAKGITCPVVIIHGDYDPHPFEGVKKPLEATIKNIKSILLQQCGHTPWIEKFVKDKFYEILREELNI